MERRGTSWTAPLAAGGAVLVLVLGVDVVASGTATSGVGPDRPPDGLITAGSLSPSATYPANPYLETPSGEVLGPRDVAVTEFREVDQHVLVTYRLSVRLACASQHVEPVVRESMSFVTVTMVDQSGSPSADPTDPSGPRGCRYPSREVTVPISLSMPLGDRGVIDGISGDAVPRYVPRGAS